MQYPVLKLPRSYLTEYPFAVKISSIRLSVFGVYLNTIVTSLYVKKLNLQKMRLVYLLGLLILSTNIYGQYIQAGLIAGLNATQVDGDTKAGFYKLGLNLGVTALIPLSDQFSTSIEILYSQKGSYERSPSNSPTPDPLKLRLNYLDVPILLNLKFKQEDKMIFSAGIAIGTLVSFKHFEDGLEQLWPTNPFKKLDINWTVGASYEFLEHFYFNLRYAKTIGHIGFVNVLGDPSGKVNRLISFRLIYMLGQ